MKSNNENGNSSGGGVCCSGGSQKNKVAKNDIAVKKNMGAIGTGRPDLFSGAGAS